MDCKNIYVTTRHLANFRSHHIWTIL